MSLEVTAEPGVEVTLPFIGGDWGGWRVSDVRVDRQSSEVGKAHQQTLRFEIASLKTGQQPVPSVAISFVDRRPLQGRDASPNSETAQADAVADGSNELILEPVSIQITSVLQADDDPTQYREAKGLADIRVPKPWSFWVLATLLGVLGVMVAGAAAVYVRRNWQRSIRQARVLPPHEWAWQQIDKLLAERLIEQDQYEPFFVRLSGIVRTYLEIRFGLLAAEQTTEEFLYAAKRSAVLTLDHQALLGQFLSASDMVKFARHRPDAAEVERAVQSARNFIRETRTEDLDAQTAQREAAA